MGRTYAHRTIEAAKVAAALLPIGNVPQTESQARPLTRLAPEAQPIASPARVDGPLGANWSYRRQGLARGPGTGPGGIVRAVDSLSRVAMVGASRPSDRRFAIVLPVVAASVVQV